MFYDSAMKTLVYQLKNLCKHNRDGSEGTRADRWKHLKLFAQQLEEMGFRHMRATSLKQKHTEALVNRWLCEGLSSGTIMNRTSHLRWWAEKIGKPNVVLRNKGYGIEKRQQVSEYSKARELEQTKLSQIKDPYIMASLKLQEAFGLRREESIKFNPNHANRDDYIRLKASWCKGGKERIIPIRTKVQRKALDFTKKIAGQGSLIPKDLQYKHQLNRYEKATNAVGLNKMHGLRHRYVQRRYQELTGWLCPHCGGPTKKELTPEQKIMDRKARLLISKELGHCRISIVATYLGV